MICIYLILIKKNGNHHTELQTAPTVTHQSETESTTLVLRKRFTCIFNYVIFATLLMLLASFCPNHKLLMRMNNCFFGEFVESPQFFNCQSVTPSNTPERVAGLDFVVSRLLCVLLTLRRLLELKLNSHLDLFGLPCEQTQ